MPGAAADDSPKAPKPVRRAGAAAAGAAAPLRDREAGAAIGRVKKSLVGFEVRLDRRKLLRVCCAWTMLRRTTKHARVLECNDTPASTIQADLEGRAILQN